MKNALLVWPQNNIIFTNIDTEHMMQKRGGEDTEKPTNIWNKKHQL